jgi:DNA-binding MarR family transcriptional regulator
MAERVTTRQHAVNLEVEREARTPAAEAFSELVVQVFRLDGILAAAGDALAKPAGQTTARWRVLAAIEHAPATVAQIARAWGLARQSVQRVADVLVREGLAAYEENPEHRRAQLVRLTGRGGAALRRIQAAQRRWAEELGAQIGEKDLRVANAALARVLRAVTSAHATSD